MVLAVNQFLATAAVRTGALSQPQIGVKNGPDCKIISRTEARSLVVKRLFFFTAAATATETAASKVVMFEVVQSADQRRFSPPSNIRLLNKFVFSAAFVHPTQH